MTLKRFWDLIQLRNGYFLRAKLDGHQGPINCLAFIGELELLISGGDDECVHVWDLKTLSCIDTLTDSGGRWGQITCIIWISGTHNGLLCLGTGRGRLVMFRRKRSHFVEVSDSQIFEAGSSIEAIKFDPNQQRLAIASHNGSVKMFRFNKEGNSPTPLIELWTVNPSQAIPRSLHFLNSGEDLVTFHLESGETFYYDSQTAALKHSRTMKTPIGNVDLDEMEKNLVVDNINTGFHIYPTGRSIPTYSLEVPTTRKHIRGVVFCENGLSVVGGSDHGKIYIFNLKAPQFNQVMMQGSQTTLVQAIASQSFEERHLIASGSSDNKSHICIWEKPTKRALQRRKREEERRGELALLFTLLVFNFALAITWKAWFPAFKSVRIYFSSAGKVAYQYLLQEFKKLPSKFQNGIKDLSPVAPTMALTQSTGSNSKLANDMETLEDRILRKILQIPPHLAKQDNKLQIKDVLDLVLW
ncbi:hypothetical protein GALMADRAFT_134096 [Galerina marginata CBS 339.88]|uniref:Uncharacterized protein n=1 Tax=Galerina marginata (strain CBS 339.88) TaxID=685588 RepID=A0A067TU67_GALM3|nr:hypothetical protein GALMADRAFT_134096 [Galerina marginata CBS 339.88]